ncbi:MAG: signal peptidase II [Eubacteriales bacterium]|nr:signal peptidase II [Eubacteriales bacterium]
MNRLIEILTGSNRLRMLTNLFSKKKKNPLLYFLTGGAVFTADQLLKSSIERQPDDTFPRDVQGTNGVLRYEKCRNRGFVLGAFQEHEEIVKTIPAVCTALLSGRLWEMLFHENGRHGEKLGLTLIISGALSNLWDRLWRGYVVDYVSIKKGFLRKIVINLGDLAIFAGAFCLLLSAFVKLLKGED